MRKKPLIYRNLNMAGIIVPGIILILSNFLVISGDMTIFKKLFSVHPEKGDNL